MKRDILTDLLRNLLQSYNPRLTVEPGTHEYETIVVPLLDRFGNIAAPHQAMDFELSPHSDTTFAPPAKVSFAPGEAGYKVVNLKVKSKPGILRIKGKIPGDTFPSKSQR